MTEPILTPFLGATDVTVYQGDCIEVMRQMPENSVDAIVTDPPYGLEFMGKGWDSFRVDDPGTNRNRGERAGSNGAKVGGTYNADGRAKAKVSYGGGNRPRTYRCTGCGKRDQFKNEHTCPSGTRWAQELVDPYCAPPTMLAFAEWTRLWALEAYRVLKPGGHLLAFAGTRTYHRMASGVEDAGFEIRDCIAWMYGSGFPKSLDVSKAIDKAAGAGREVVGKDRNFGASKAEDGKTAYGDYVGEWSLTVPATEADRKWSGWGTALKPAFEPVVVARKPLVGTVAQNVLEHGTGALNIDGCRIGWSSDADRESVADAIFVHDGSRSAYGDYATDGEDKRMADSVRDAGRWPANVTLDEDAAAMLDEQSGSASYNPDGVFGQCKKNDGSTIYGGGSGIPPSPHGVFGYGDRGGPSRFFYTAKASKKDRNTNGANNTHPTVKPTTLMRWLIRLVTPPGGIILDPFGGSGSTGVAARAEGVRCILIEREAEYLDIIRQRLDEGPLFANLD